MSELAPSFAKYEGTELDPQTDVENALKKLESGMQKYDDFFLKAKELIIRVRIAARTVKIAKNNPSSLAKNIDIVPILVKEMAPLAASATQLINEGKNLAESVKSDFTGLDILKAPAVASQMLITSKELVSAGAELGELLSNLSSLPGGNVDSSTAANQKQDSPKKGNDKQVNTEVKVQTTIPKDHEGKIKQLDEIAIRNRQFADYLKEKLK